MSDHTKTWSSEPSATSRRAPALASALAAVCAIAILAFLATPAQAAEDHLFDPVLSLEGDCNGEDGVRDPSCVGEPPAYPAGNAPRAFELPCGVATDSHGDIYVANPNPDAQFSGWEDGEIDVFDPQGRFLTKIPNNHGPCGLAIDSTGNVYVVERDVQNIGGIELAFVSRYEPDSYPPTETTDYSLGAQFESVVKEPGEATDFCAAPKSVAVDPSNDHLYIGKDCYVEEYGSAAEGSPLNPLLDCCIGEKAAGNTETSLNAVDVYGSNHDVYAVNRTNNAPIITSVFVFDGTTGETKCELKGTGAAPYPTFDFGNGGAIAVDQADGELYVYDLQHDVIDQFELDGEGGAECPQYSYARQMPPPTNDPTPLFDTRYVDIAVDGPCRTGGAPSEACNLGEYKSPNEGEVYYTVGVKDSNSHLYAFKPRRGGPPEVLAQAASGITEAEAVLRAELNPNALETEYHFEYTTQADFEAYGYANAISVPDPPASAGNGGAFVSVAVPATGLEPGVVYRFRLVASNCEDEKAVEGECLTLGEGNPGGAGEDASFATYPASVVLPCPNEALRTGPSKALPDCRAYELVTPPDTNGHIPTMAMLGGDFSFSGFPTTMVSPDGESLVFGSRSGSLPGIGGGGYQDTYEALRDESTGWQSQFTGMSGVQAERPLAAGISADHRYAFWYIWPGDRGTLIGGGDGAHYLRVPAGTQSSPNCAVPNDPDGRLEWIACGTLGFDPGSSGDDARGMWISTGAGHVVFETPEQLQGCAPPTGNNAIYDRTPGGETRCVSLLPGEVTPSVGADYRGVSADGSAVAFAVTGTLYVRLGDAKTVKVAEGNPTFGGIASNGSRVFYLAGGDVFAFDTGSEETIQVGSGGESTLAYVSADGSHAFFVSPQQLDGAEGEAGKDNLYAWDGAAVRFIAVLDPLDVNGEAGVGQGLGKWVLNALGSGFAPGTGPANVSARTTPDGSVFIFESRVDLTGYESNGHRQIYRYEESALPGKRLRCLSCNPTGAPTGSAAQLESPPTSVVETFPPVNALTQIANVTADGDKVFFQSAERLVSADIDGMQDVYEWTAQGVGGCDREAGCLALISYGRSASDDYLYAMTPDGSDVFFLSGDTLVPQDPDGTPSIYDARVNGGFPAPPPPPGDCLGDACQPAVVAPDIGALVTSGAKPGNAARRPKHRCPKGKRRVRRAGKVRCVPARKKHKRHAKHKRSHAKRGASR